MISIFLLFFVSIQWDGRILFLEIKISFSFLKRISNNGEKIRNIIDGSWNDQKAFKS